MLNDILAGMAKALGAAFGGGYRVYENDVSQGLQEPCFFIAALRPSQRDLLAGRAVRRYPFDVHFFPAPPGTNAELYDMAERLMAVLRYIELPGGGLLRGRELSYEAVDGVLHFFISYSAVVNAPKVLPNMEILDMDMNTKRG